MLSVSAAKLMYNGLAYPALSMGARLAALFSKKLRKGLRGRQYVTANARAFRNRHPDARVVLFHCASAGELEGIKPLAMRCREQGLVPCVSYFSPSAEAALKPDEFGFADYSPFDSAFAVRAFYSALLPEVVLISKHDVWPNQVWQAKLQNIPIWLINGNFHKVSIRSFVLSREFHRAIYGQLDGVLTVSEDDATRASRVSGNPQRVWSVGDSRFDRVLHRAEMKNTPYPALHDVLTQHAIVVGGSTHEDDEDLLIGGFKILRGKHPELRLLLVPHDPSETAVQRIQAKSEASGLTCTELSDSLTEADVVIVNQSGVLADLYQYGCFAFVGGGFDRGVHSVLEPMAHGLKVICGPKIHVSREANDAMAERLLFVANDTNEFINAANEILANDDKTATTNFVASRAGVVDRILDIVLSKSNVNSHA